MAFQSRTNINSSSRGVFLWYDVGMPKKLKLVVVGLIILISFGSVYFFATRGNQENSQPNSTSPTLSNESSTPSTPTASATDPAPGTYLEYSEDLLATTKDTKILFFHAPWCSQCRALESSIKSGTIPNNVTIFKVDYDSNNRLRQKYGVTIQTTLVKISDTGDELKKFVAYDDPSLSAITKELL